MSYVFSTMLCQLRYSQFPFWTILARNFRFMRFHWNCHTFFWNPSYGEFWPKNSQFWAMKPSHKKKNTTQIAHKKKIPPLISKLKNLKPCLWWILAKKQLFFDVETKSEKKNTTEKLKISCETKVVSKKLTFDLVKPLLVSQ